MTASRLATEQHAKGPPSSFANTRFESVVRVQVFETGYLQQKF
jgi:hypothetical protein